MSVGSCQREESRNVQCNVYCIEDYSSEVLNPLKPTGYVMHQQFNIQQLYALPTLYLCVLYLYENKQRLLPLTP
jgi:hypothetical protein